MSGFVGWGITCSLSFRMIALELPQAFRQPVSDKLKVIINKSLFNFIIFPLCACTAFLLKIAIEDSEYALDYLEEGRYHLQNLWLGNEPEYTGQDCQYNVYRN